MKALLLLATLAIAPMVAPEAVFLQPGMAFTSSVSTCTLGFLFEGADGRRYFGTAAHCVRPNEVLSWGQVTTFRQSDDDCAQGGCVYDFALIRVNTDVSTDGEVYGIPNAPTGVADPGDYHVGDRITWTGAGGPPLGKTRQGTYLGAANGEDNWCGSGAFAPGDSGGPVVIVGGKALGFVATLVSPNLPECPTAASGNTVQYALGNLQLVLAN